MKKNKLQQTPHIIAFLDILGATNKMQSEDKSDLFLQELYDIYNFAKIILAKTKNFRGDKLNIKIFSDNIVIAEEIENINDAGKIFEAYFDILNFVLFISTKALTHKNLTRGAISVGNLYMDETFIFGKSLVNAYHGESKIANYPRVIIDKQNFKDILTNTNTSIELLNYERVLQKDIDGELFVDPFGALELIYMNDLSGEIKYLKNVKTFITNEYKKLLKNSNIAVLQKYFWLANQFNYYCLKNNLDLQIDLNNEKIL